MVKLTYRLTALGLSFVFLASCAPFSPMLRSDQVSIIDTAQGKMAELPKHLEVRSVLREELSSSRSRVGQRFMVMTVEPVCLDRRVLIPVGTTIHGEVADIKPPKGGMLNAKIVMKFDRIDLRGRSFPFPAKAAPDITALAEKAGGFAAQEAGKHAIAYCIPVLGWIFLAMDVNKAIDHIEADKQVILHHGAPVIVELTDRADVPLG